MNWKLVILAISVLAIGAVEAVVFAQESQSDRSSRLAAEESGSQSEKDDSIDAQLGEFKDWLPNIEVRKFPAPEPSQTATPAKQDLASPHIVGWLSQLLRANLPPVYEDTRNWGRQKEVWDGVDIQRDGLKIRTHSKRKLVNDGTWTRYRIAPVDPDNRMTIDFHRLEMLGDGKVHFEVTIELLLDVFGRMSHWVRDVQLISLSANADAACKLTLRGTVGFMLNPLQLPPDITIKPHVDSAHVDIVYFRLRRISQVGGNWAKHLGNGLRRILDEKLEETNAKLTDKINSQLAKKSDRMSFSTQVWLQSKLPLPTSN